MLEACKANSISFYKGIHNANSTREKVMTGSSALLSLALFIISAVALITILKNDPIMVGIRGNLYLITIGVALASLVVYIAAGKHSRPAGIGKEVIQCITLLALGILAGTGIINTDQLAYGVIGTYLLASFMFYGCGPSVIGCGKSIAVSASGLDDSEGQKAKLLNNREKYRSINRTEV